MPIRSTKCLCVIGAHFTMHGVLTQHFFVALTKALIWSLGLVLAREV